MSKTIWDESNMVELKDTQNLVEGLLSLRGLKKNQIKSFIQPNYDFDLSDPFMLPDVNKASDRIIQAIDSGEKIVIYGDYDIDGLTATALLNDALSSMGANVTMYIPDRFEEGYGLNTEALLNLKQLGAKLVISVDCGVNAHGPVAEAKKAGLDVIITDHHEPDQGKPKASIACVNPKLTKKESTLNDLAGVGVAFYLVRALQLLKLTKQNVKFTPLKLGQEKWLLDLVALGTVCDVVPLTGDNRVLTKFGLMVLRQTKRLGIMWLAKISGVDISKITESDLGFKLGPRLNAAGRLAHAKKALELLTTTDEQLAASVANELNVLNTQRQNETKSIFIEANKMAKKYKDQPILVLSSPDWSHGVVGIVASRIAEKWHKPTILLQELGEQSKGSARSYNDFSIIEAIGACSTMLEKFGGHKFAAGLTLRSDLVEEFRYRINEYAINNMDPSNNFRTITVNLGFRNIEPSIDIYDELVKLAPFGNSNPIPLCKATFTIIEIRLVGSDASHLRLRLRGSSGMEHIAIGFGMANNWPWLEQGSVIDMVFKLTENIWNSKRNHQLEIIDIHKTNT
jgi:single-stranded-DNA-specific exonuclease